MCVSAAGLLQPLFSIFIDLSLVAWSLGFTAIIPKKTATKTIQTQVVSLNLLASLHYERRKVRIFKDQEEEEAERQVHRKKSNINVTSRVLLIFQHDWFAEKKHKE